MTGRGAGAGFDVAVNYYSPDGQIFQLVYAGKAAENSGTAIAIRGKDGVVFAVEKIVTSKLYEKGANRRIFNIDTHIGMAAAGLVPDARQLSIIASDEASSYRMDYGTKIPLADVITRMSGYMQFHTITDLLRPFGSVLMIGSWSEEKGAELHCLEPSGSSYGYWGCAAGKAKSAAQTELEKIKMKEMNCAELVKEAAKIIYLVHDEVKDKMFELEMSWVGEFTNGVHQKVPDDVQEEAEKAAAKALEEKDDTDEDME